MSRIRIKNKNRKKKAKSEHQLIDLEFKKAYALQLSGEVEHAEILYKKILKIDPCHSDALNLLGTIYLDKGDYDTAVELIKRAIKCYPHGSMYYNNLGTVYRKKKMGREAKESYRKAIQLNPKYAEAYNNLGTILQEEGQGTQAIECFERAFKIKPGFATAYYNLGMVLCEQGQIPASLYAYKEALAINPVFTEAFSNLLYTLHFSDSISPEEIFKEHETWAKTIAYPLGANISPHPNNQNPERKIRIGYVSPDFCTHSVSFFIESVFEHHDRERFEIYCYSNTPRPDTVTWKLMDLVDHWLDIVSISDDEASDLVRMDKIDILVDLAGHTRNNRMLLFALKPAPIQITWLGYPNTTGLQTMDYRITDHHADPAGMSEYLHSEKLYRIKDSFFCFKPSVESQPVSDLSVLKTGVITFGSFNTSSKISPTIIRIWASILKKVPDSRLKLKGRSYDDFGMRKYLLDFFDSEGVSSDRIWFEGYRVTLKEHFLLYNTVDIALDTFPYHGTTTTCEALWMGVPVITLKGKTHVSRVGVSILTNVGLQKLIADSHDDYVNKAVTLANDRELLAVIRSGIRNKMKASPLLNPGAFTSNLEEGFRMMWREWCVVKHPEDISHVPAEDELIMNNNLEWPMKEIYKKNLMVLKDKHPAVVSLMDTPSSFDMDVRPSRTGTPNLYVKDSSGVYSPLYSEPDPLADLSGLLSTIQGVKGKVVCLMGCGLCIHVAAILETIGEHNLLVLFEAEPAVFRAALSSVDLEVVLNHPNIRLAVGSCTNPYELLSGEDDKLYTSNGGEFIEYKKALDLVPSWYADARKSFEQFFTKRVVARVTAADAGRSFFENSFKNLLIMAESSPINELKDRFKGKPAIIVASGPSLILNIHEIKQAQDRAVIVAADSAVAPLINNGIIPHFVVSVDHNDFTYEKLAPCIEDLKETSLVFLPDVTPKICNYINFSSTHYAFLSESSKNLFNKLLGKQGDNLDDVHSSIHLAIAAAQSFGCDPIIFTGLDFSFAGKRDHAEGTILSWGNDHVVSENDVMIESVFGGQVASSQNFIAMIEICEHMIRTVSDRIYIDATEGGAKIGGTRIMTLSDTIDTYCKNSITILNTQPRNGILESGSIILKNLKSLKNVIDSCMDSLTGYFAEAKKVEQFLETKRKSIGAPQSFPEKIKKSITNMDKINVALEREQVVSYLQNLLTQSYDEYLALVMGTKDAGGDSDSGKRFLAGLDQQVFVQKIRKETLTVFMNQISFQIDLFSRLCELENSKKKNPEDNDTNLRLIEFYYNHDCLQKIEELLVSYSGNAETDFYKAFVKIKRGAVEAGKVILDKVIEDNLHLKTKANSFINSITDEWLKEKLFKIYMELVVNRVLTLNPEHKQAIFYKQKDLIEKTIRLIEKGSHVNALLILKEAYKVRSFDDSPLLALFAGLLIFDDKDEEAIQNFKQSIVANHVSIERENLLKKLCKGGDSIIQFEPTKKWVHILMEYAREEMWARRALQELWWMNFEDITTKIFIKRISPDQLNEMEIKLNVWSEIKQIIPEWYYLKAVYEWGRGEHSLSRGSFENAVSVEKSTIPIYAGDTYLSYNLGLYYICYGDFQKGLEKHLSIIESSETIVPLNWVLASLLLLRAGLSDRANDVLRTAFSKKLDAPWDIKMNEYYQEGDLIQKFEENETITFISAWLMFVASIMFDTGQMEIGIDFLRGAVNYEPGIILDPKKTWMYEILLEKWREDCEVIEGYLKDEKFNEAECLLGEWEATRPVLKNFDIVKARIVMEKEGGEESLHFLSRCVDEHSENNELLEYYARLLFVYGNQDDGILMLEKAVVLNPQSALLWEEVGDAFIENHDYQSAIVAYERCLSALPDRVESLCKIGDTYYADKKKQSAAVAYEAVLSICPDHKHARERLCEIRNEFS